MNKLRTEDIERIANEQLGENPSYPVEVVKIANRLGYQVFRLEKDITETNSNPRGGGIRVHLPRRQPLQIPRNRPQGRQTGSSGHRRSRHCPATGSGYPDGEEGEGVG